MADGRLGDVVRTTLCQYLVQGFIDRRYDYLRLRLGNVDDGSRHAANQNHATGRLALHEMAGDGGSKQVCTVNIDGPQLAHAVNGIVDGLKVLGEAGGSDEVVNLAMLLDDFGDAGLDRLGVGDVGVVGGDLGDSDGFSLSAVAF